MPMKRQMSLLLFLIFGLAGCAFQAKIIEHRHWELSDTIRQTHNEQLLLNIVRLRYDDMPYFLQVSGITTSFSAGANIGATGTIPEKLRPVTPKVLGLSGGLSYSESPVVTWSLPDSREYFGRLLAPMGTDQITALANSGWDPTRILRVGIKKMNRLRNKDYRVEQGIITPSSYGEFMEALKLMNELYIDGLIDFAYGVKSSMGAGKIPLEKMDTRAIPQGLQYGLQFMTRDDPKVFEPLKLFKPLFLRFSKRSDDDPRARRLRKLLDLNPNKYSFGIVDTANSGVEQLRSESGKLSQVFEPGTNLDEIVVNTRSMMEVLFFASAYVQAPNEEVSSKAARDIGPVEPLWFNVLSSQHEPPDAWLKVKFRGYWFYIPTSDLSSRASFGMLDAIFESVVGNVPGAKPLLTLPVK